MIKYGSSEKVKEEPQMEMTTKPNVEVAAISAAHIDIEINLNLLKQEPGLVQSVKSEPALLVKEESLEDSGPEENEQQFVQGVSTSSDTDSVKEDTSPNDLLNVKREFEDMYSGPTVLQHMDLHYSINKQNMSAVTEENTFVDDCNKAMPCIGVKESVEDQLRDTKTISCKYYDQMTTEDDFNETYLKSCMGQQKDLQQHCLCQHVTTSYSKTSMMTSSTVTKPSNQSRNECKKQQLFVCHVCEKGYSSMVGLNFHKPSHSGVGLYVCIICDAKFRTKSNLTHHLRMHTGEKPYQCATCGARFAISSNLTRHMRVHTGEKPYQCDTCDASFTSKSHVRVHMRVHTGEKPYRCTMCDASYAQNSSLTGHMRVHTGEKPYQCDRCDATFARSGYLNAHMKIHIGEKPYQCDTCVASFAQRYQLTRHVRVHTGEKPYKCDMCDARFTDRSGFNRHRKSRGHIDRVAMHVQ